MEKIRKPQEVLEADNYKAGRVQFEKGYQETLYI
jgi:hypothetical protein